MLSQSVLSRLSSKSVDRDQHLVNVSASSTPNLGNRRSQRASSRFTQFWPRNTSGYLIIVCLVGLAVYFISYGAHLSDQGVVLPKHQRLTENDEQYEQTVLIDLRHPPLPPRQRVSPGFLRLMCMGDSITMGKASTKGDKSYRYWMWKLFQRDPALRKISFVGSQRGVFGAEGIPGVFQLVKDVPGYLAADQYHEAHWGYKLARFTANIETWIQRSKPHIIICLAGVLDVLHDHDIDVVKRDFALFIQKTMSLFPSGKVLVGLPFPIGRKYLKHVHTKHLNQRVSELTSFINIYLQNLSEKSRNFVIVDTQTGFDPELHTYDGVNPNSIGEQKIADAFYQAVKLLLPKGVETFLAEFENDGVTAPTDVTVASEDAATK